MSDVNRNYWAIDRVAYAAPTYKGEALDRLRAFRRSLWERARAKLTLTLSMDSMLFELAEHTYEQDLKRLDRLITKQIARERERYGATTPNSISGARNSSTTCRLGFLPIIGPAVKDTAMTTFLRRDTLRNEASRSATDFSTWARAR